MKLPARFCPLAERLGTSQGRNITQTNKVTPFPDYFFSYDYAVNHALKRFSSEQIHLLLHLLVSHNALQWSCYFFSSLVETLRFTMVLLFVFFPSRDFSRLSGNSEQKNTIQTIGGLIQCGCCMGCCHKRKFLWSAGLVPTEGEFTRD